MIPSHDERRIHDAVFTLALHRYITSRTPLGERVTDVAAERIYTMACRLGMRPAKDVKVLGFLVDGIYIRPLHIDQVIAAQRRISGGRALRLLDRLSRRFDELSVEQLELPPITSSTIPTERAEHFSIHVPP